MTELFDRKLLMMYIRGNFFERAYFTHLEEFGDPVEAFRCSLHLFDSLGPDEPDSWGYIIPSVFGITFDYERYDEVYATEGPLSRKRFLGLCQDLDDFWYDEDGALCEAITCGLRAGILACPKWVTPVEPDVEMSDIMAKLYYSMFVEKDESWPDEDRHGVVYDALGEFALEVEEVFKEAFAYLDDRYFPESKSCARRARKAFWGYFGLTTDDGGVPIIVW